MAMTFARWFCAVLAVWVMKQIFNTVVSPFFERPLGWLKYKARWLALKLRLAVPEEPAYAMA